MTPLPFGRRVKQSGAASTPGLDHPHIFTLLDSGAVDGLLYHVMPFARGESLRDRLQREHPLGIEGALSITSQVASALDYAHRQGVIHRDIKPENLVNWIRVPGRDSGRSRWAAVQ